MGRERRLQHDSRVNFRDLEDDEWSDALEERLFRGYGSLPWDSYPEDLGEQSVEESRVTKVNDLFTNVYEQLAERFEDTPDFHKFRLQEEVPIFVYDMMKYEGCRHSFLRDACNYYGTAHTVAKSFRMFSSDKLRAEHPAFIASQENGNSAALRGELYGVAPEALLDIDNFYVGNGKYKRISTLVVAEEQEAVVRPDFRKWKNKAVVRAMIYLGKYGCWENAKLTVKGRLSHHGTNTPEIARQQQFYELDPKQQSYRFMD